jgi:TRAP-type mannitol/chloroaromatic compound transport system permease small subunit
MPKALANFLHRIVGPTLALFYCIILTWKGWSVAMYSFSIGERSMSIWGEPLFPIKIMVPICYCLLAVVVLRNLCRGILAYTSLAPSEQG